LFGAASYGQTKAVSLLLDNGADIDRIYSLNGPPLFGAIYGSHVDTVALLLLRGANVNIRLADDTALKIAKAKGLEKIVTLLQERGAKE
jgi:ankyrin repeat protein